MVIPSFNSNIGKHGAVTDPKNGLKLRFNIVDEVFCYSTTGTAKVVCCQKLKFDQDGHSELRFCFYMYNGEKWEFHRAAPMLSFKDLQAIVHEATKKQWIVG